MWDQLLLMWMSLMGWVWTMKFWLLVYGLIIYFVVTAYNANDKKK